MFKKIYKFLTSLRLTITLICLLAAVFVIGLWVPQKDLLRTIYFEWKRHSPTLVSFLDFFQLTSIYTSWVTLTLWLLFFVNLSLVVWQRIPLIRKRIELAPERIADPETVPGYSFKKSYPLGDGQDGAFLLKSLAGKGFALIGDENGWYGIKNRYSPIGFAIFHLSFFLILLGGVISVYTQFIGYVDLAQNEPFTGELAQYNQALTPRLPVIGSIPDASFTIRSIVPRVVKDTPTGISVKLVDRDGHQHEVDINQPYTTGNTSFVFKHLGVAPLFVLKDPAGKEVGGAYIKLDVVKGKQDTFQLGDFEFIARFYPDYELQDGKPATRTAEFNNPTFVISVVQQGKKIAEGTVPKNGAMEFAGYRLVMKDMPFWVRFYVIKQYGLPLVYAGYALASIAVIWRLVFFRREMVGAVRTRDGRRCLLVACRSEYYKSLAEDEFSKIFNEILRLKVKG